MSTKETILAEIKRTAKENKGKPLGRGKFEKESGIKPYDWQRYWVRFSDAQKEAGFTANTLQVAYPDEFLLTKIIYLARKLGKFPGELEIIFEKRNNDSEFPSKSVFSGRFGNKNQFIKKVLEFCEGNSDYNDVAELCSEFLKKYHTKENEDNITKNYVGEVYLFKSGRYYKIGKTKDTVRRGSELRIQLPERMDLIHSIKTDDPSGIETYWHTRFKSKRMNGEWFDLNGMDIKAFKRWRRIV
jgi:hypothetical protein